METNCKACGIEITPDDATNEAADDRLCRSCASSCEALLVELNSPARKDAAPLMAEESNASEDESAWTALADSSTAEETAGDAALRATDAYAHAAGVSLYSVSVKALLVIVVCGAAALLIFGFLKPSGESDLAFAASDATQVTRETDALENPTLPPDAPGERQQPAPEVSVKDEAAEAKTNEEEELLTEEEFEKLEGDAASNASEEAKPVVQAAIVATSSTEAAKAESASASSAGGNFTVQVGSFNKSSEAEGRADDLRSVGFDARVAAVNLQAKGTWFRVQSGRFSTREEAKVYEKRLRSSGAAQSTLVAEVQ